ncbi:GIY-YIG nuclease family protein [Patescibacteria group bacterium]|nr:GIY-YIG nuclease family protein [Patescibacteria group bacterium]MBU4347454.1 GIY-YIG nuclease family protein [Patescibacteria group bacterium]MBU4455295.1 GIY-YIG nuclease family protein [Patescibacteria group bacterium]MCG2690900.1 GIY-YIG nuclease family protein [Candidatus Parcubacteria bacterium]
MAFVYILKSLTDGRYYIGSTTNLDQRIEHHKNGHTPSTKRFGRISLVFSQKYEKLSDARIIEKKLKKLKRKDYIEKIIKEGFIKMKP